MTRDEREGRKWRRGYAWWEVVARGSMVAAVVWWVVSVVGCAGTPTGPVELLERTGVEAQECRGQACLEGAEGALRSGAIEEAQGYYRSACESGGVESCLALGTLLVMGGGGSADRERGRRLMRWSCEEGLKEACHDAELLVFAEDRAEGTRSVFEHLCKSGVGVACTNLGNLMASGRGGVRDHRQAQELFRGECERGAPVHVIGELLEGQELDLIPSLAYGGEQACEQLEVVSRGLFEERVQSAMGAEREALGACFREGLEEGEVRRGRRGRIVLEAEVSEDGGGGGIEIVEDTLELEGVAECVERSMGRHLDDGESGPFRSRWGISFVSVPEAEEVVVGCNPAEVRNVVGRKVEDLRRCGAEHLGEHPEDSGAAVVLLDFRRTGELREVTLYMTTRAPELETCLRREIEGIELTPFVEGACPISIPLVFSDGKELQFLITP